MPACALSSRRQGAFRFTELRRNFSKEWPHGQTMGPRTLGSCPGSPQTRDGSKCSSACETHKGASGDLPASSQPSNETTEGEHETGKAGADDGAGHGVQCHSTANLITSAPNVVRLLKDKLRCEEL